LNYFSCINNYCLHANDKIIHVSGRGLHWVECQTLIRFLRDQGMRILSIKVKNRGEEYYNKRRYYFNG
jgi:hypothetical protein